MSHRWSEAAILLQVWSAFTQRLACSPAGLLVLGSSPHQHYEKLTWVPRLTQFKLGTRKWSWEVKVAGLIFITSPIKCWLDYYKMRVAPYSLYCTFTYCYLECLGLGSNRKVRYCSESNRQRKISFLGMSVMWHGVEGIEKISFLGISIMWHGVEGI